MEKDYLIEKWLTNNLTEAEQAAFEKLEDHDLCAEIIESAHYFKASHFSNPAEYKQLDARLSSEVTVKKLNWMQPLLRLTGVFVMGIAIYFLFFYTNLTEVTTLASQKTTIELPDASTVTLNALSEISFSETKWERNREVNLEGEAYFKVSKGKVFDVVTSEGTVTVVGTQFNVKQRGNFFEVYCYEGIVQVNTNTYSKELVAGDSFRLYEGKVSLGNTHFQSPQWIKHLSDFRSAPLHEVIAELERQYNIKVIYDTNNENRLFTGGFVHNNLENALKSITDPQELNYDIESSNTVRLYKRGQ